MSEQERMLRAAKLERSVRATRSPDPIDYARAVGVAGWSVPTSERHLVFADWISLQRGQTALVVATSSGSVELDEAPTFVRSTVRELFAAGTPLTSIVAVLNRRLCEHPRAMFFETTVAVSDPVQQSLQLLNAGCAPPFMEHPATRTRDVFPANYPALGIIDDLPEPVPTTLTVNPGDVLVCHAGVVDLYGPEGIEFPIGRLQETTRRAAGASAYATKIADSIKRDLREFTASGWDEFRTAVLVAVF